MQLEPLNSNSGFLEPLSAGEQAVAPGFACVVGNLLNFAEDFKYLYFSWEITLLVQILTEFRETYTPMRYAISSSFFSQQKK